MSPGLHGSTVLVPGGTGGIGLATGLAGLGARVGVLVNDVGGYWAHRHVTADGLERTFALNHLAPFPLTRELQDLLVASAPARVVTVSSGARSMRRIDLDDLQGERSYNGQRACNHSKLANVLFTHELAPARGLRGDRDGAARGGAHLLRS
jgi:NAD(P)-dependent dehydrogenase (short-subunit alcohol dehydrogenase family)